MPSIDRFKVSDYVITHDNSLVELLQYISKETKEVFEWEQWAIKDLETKKEYVIWLQGNRS